MPGIDEDLALAKELLLGARRPAKEVFALAKRLTKTSYMHLAWQLAERVAGDQLAELEAEKQVELHQKWALWLSKDERLSVEEKNPRALRILDAIGRIEGQEGLERTEDNETLGIAGGIWKRTWEADSRKAGLETALRYYDRGYANGIARDNGYTAINAAFLNDLLAHIESETGRATHDQQAASAARREKATRIREEVLAYLVEREGEPAWEGGPPLDDVWWYHATVAEAEFGSGAFAAAGTRLRKAQDRIEVDPWELETTARQLAWLARLKDPTATKQDQIEESEPWKGLAIAFGAGWVRTLFVGKVGLALSGGGFRASFFHIGVLAALAEFEVLQHVEVLSCVSGGSIIGAHYYLELRNLLQTKADREITPKDYRDVVTRVATDFLAGVQKNLRTRVGSNPFSNLRMMVDPGYTQTNRLGELIERHLFKRVPDGEGDRARHLNGLYVRPLDKPDLMPRYENWQRVHKVPVLVLNATALNTGHNWQFTAAHLGEPASTIKNEIDVLGQLEIQYYKELPPERQAVRLGDAVAASACVPGLFSPITLRGLYEDVNVRLVDGGVHDNQGTTGLVDQDCSVFLVSDASGQMHAQDDPTTGMLGVPLRANSILMSGLRTARYGELVAKQRSRRLNGVMFVHLRQELQKEAETWGLGASSPALTSYGIPPHIQEKLAQVRTDLDSFSECEAYALMSSGRAMTRGALPAALPDLIESDAEHEWPFSPIDKALAEGGAVVAHLDASKYGAFRIWRLSKVLKVVVTIVGLVLLGALVRYVVSDPGGAWSIVRGGASMAGVGILVALSGLFVLHLALRLFGVRKPMSLLGLALVLALVGWIAALVHLVVFDGLFLRRGKLAKLAES